MRERFAFEHARVHLTHPATHPLLWHLIYYFIVLKSKRFKCRKQFPDIMSTATDTPRAPASRRELLDYLEGFRAFEPRIKDKIMNPQQAEVRAAEIMAHVRRVMGPVVSGEYGGERQQYYRTHVQRVERAFNAGDFSLSTEGFAGALELLAGRLLYE